MSKKITNGTATPPSAPWSESRAKLHDDPEVRAAYDALEPEYTLIRELIDLRIKRGLSQRELAKRAGMKQPTLARVESGKTASLRTLRRVADALNADVRVSLVPRHASRKGKNKDTRR
jgi:DNA-binding XRE family transcriptional regulator